MAKHNKEYILEKGIELMRKNGYYGTGIQQVLKACGIPKGSFYHFFESKQDFALQAIDKYANKSIAKLENISEDASLTPANQIRRFFSELMNYYISQNYEMTCLMSIISFEVGSTDPVLATRIKEKFGKIKHLLAGIIALGQQQSELRDDFSSFEMADYLINSFNGALVNMKYEGSDRAIRQFFKINLAFVLV